MSISDEIVEKAVQVYVVAPLPSEMPEWQETREAMRAALEAVWPESAFTKGEAQEALAAINYFADRQDEYVTEELASFITKLEKIASA